MHLRNCNEDLETKASILAEIEKAARERGIPTLTLSSSVTAETFYARLGFKTLREAYHGDERAPSLVSSSCPPVLEVVWRRNRALNN